MGKFGVHRRNIIFLCSVSILRLIFSVHHKLNSEPSSNFGADDSLPDDKRLKRMQQIGKSQAREQPVEPPVGGKQDVVKTTHMDPVLEVLPTDFGIQMRRPSNRQWIHPILIFQNMGCKRTVFPAASWNYDVITRGPAILIEQRY